MVEIKYLKKGSAYLRIPSKNHNLNKFIIRGKNREACDDR